MLYTVRDAAEIEQLQRRLEGLIRAAATKKVSAFVGYQGGSEEGEVYWLAKHDIWACFKPGWNRFWNAFGRGEPSPGGHLSIVVEVNFHYEGIGRRIAGAFARDLRKRVYVVHRGGIGGGRKGIGKALFRRQFSGQWIPLDEGRDMVALIGHLEGNRFLAQLASFVTDVARIKAQTKSRDGRGAEQEGGDQGADQPEHRPEFEGLREYVLGHRVVAECDHGLVLNRLADVLLSAGYRLYNDRSRDLCLVDSGGRRVAVFEVKTDTSLQSIYTAVGQLLYHATEQSTRPSLIAVFPRGIGRDTARRLAGLGIRLLTYDLSQDGTSVTFDWPSPHQFLGYIGSDPRFRTHDHVDESFSIDVLSED